MARNELVTPLGDSVMDETLNSIRVSGCEKREARRVCTGLSWQKTVLNDPIPWDLSRCGGYSMSSTSQLTTFSDTKTCRRCGDSKPAASFSKHAWCKACCSAYNKVYSRKSKASPEQVRRNNLRKNFGITPEQYDEMFQAQKGACAICKATTNFTFKNLCVDHSHVTGKVRGLLCLNCNTALGQFKDSTHLLLQAVDYLEGFCE